MSEPYCISLEETGAGWGGLPNLGEELASRLPPPPKTEVV